MPAFSNSSNSIMRQFRITPIYRLFVVNTFKSLRNLLIKGTWMCIYKKVVQNKKNDKTMTLAFVLEVMGVSLCSTLLGERVTMNQIGIIRSILMSIHQNFLCICQFIIDKIPIKGNVTL